MFLKQSSLLGFLLLVYNVAFESPFWNCEWYTVAALMFIVCLVRHHITLSIDVQSSCPVHQVVLSAESIHLGWITRIKLNHSHSLGSKLNQSIPISSCSLNDIFGNAWSDWDKINFYANYLSEFSGTLKKSWKCGLLTLYHGQKICAPQRRRPLLF